MSFGTTFALPAACAASLETLVDDRLKRVELRLHLGGFGGAAGLGEKVAGDRVVERASEHVGGQVGDVDIGLRHAERSGLPRQPFEGLGALGALLLLTEQRGDLRVGLDQAELRERRDQPLHLVDRAAGVADQDRDVVVGDRQVLARRRQEQPKDLVRRSTLRLRKRPGL